MEFEKKELLLCSCSDGICESSSVGRARPSQGRGRGFEPRFSLFFLTRFLVEISSFFLRVRDEVVIFGGYEFNGFKKINREDL